MQCNAGRKIAACLTHRTHPPHHSFRAGTGMQSSSGFALPHEARIIVENEELREFMRRYDKLARQHGGKNVPKTAVARLVCEMELEGALHLKPSRGVESRSMPGSPAKRPESAPAQPSDMDALTCAVRPESAAQ